MSKDIPIDRPIIFSTPMVRALLDGRKTMTRRLAHLKPRVAIQVGTGPVEPVMVPSLWQSVKVGDRLWVRETFRTENVVISGALREQARYPEDAGSLRREFDPMRYKSPIHMPRWASRLTLIVRSTKVERLHDISESDAQAEGWMRRPEISDDSEVHRDAARDWFSDLWERLHGVESWKANPAIVALTFRVVTANIDAPGAVAA